MFMKAFASCEARCSLKNVPHLSLPLTCRHSPIHVVQTISRLPVQGESICWVSSKNVHTPHPCKLNSLPRLVGSPASQIHLTDASCSHAVPTDFSP